jgi:hypothetical protein
MHIARLIILLCLVLGILFAYSPLVRGEVSQAWQYARPDVILLMDSLYATIRNFVAGTDPHEGIHDDAPGVDFDTIITEERAVLL